DIQGRQAHVGEHPLGGGLPHARVGFFLGGDAPLADAGPLLNPLIRRVQNLRELVVGHDARGQIAAGAGQLREGALHTTALPARCVNSASMWRSISFSTIWTATRMAFRMALGWDDPWQMMETPLTPSSGAPP